VFRCFHDRAPRQHTYVYCQDLETSVSCGDSAQRPYVVWPNVKKETGKKRNKEKEAEET